jgi:Mg2+-importing ATPase
MIFIGPISSIFDYATFFLMLYFFGCAAYVTPAEGAAASESSAIFERLFHTGWFVESLLTQTLIVHIIRTNRIPLFQSRASRTMTATTLGIMAVGIWLPYSPLAPFLHLVPLPAVYFAWIAGFLLAYSILTHNVKMWFARKFGTD